MFVFPRKLLQFFVAVSLVIRRSCSHFPFVSIIESSGLLISERDRAVAHPQGPWFLFLFQDPFLGPCSSVTYIRAEQSEGGSPPRSLFGSRS